MKNIIFAKSLFRHLSVSGFAGKKILLILPVVLLMAAGCGSKVVTQNNSSGPTPTSTAILDGGRPTLTPTPTGQQPFNLIKVYMNAQNNSGESGSASIYDVNGKAKVILTMAGAPANTVQPNQVYFGSCSNLGAVRYPLTNAGNGIYITILPVSLAELASIPFAINVHKSTTEIGAYVACGDSTSMDTSISADPSLGAK
jgi:hypothetical protein